MFLRSEKLGGLGGDEANRRNSIVETNEGRTKKH